MFRAGDRVRCLDAGWNGDFLRNGDIYTVRLVRERRGGGAHVIELEGAEEGRGFQLRRFELVQEAPQADVPQNSHIHYVVLFKNLHTDRVNRHSYDDERQAMATCERIQARPEDYTLLIKKKITLKY